MPKAKRPKIFAVPASPEATRLRDTLYVRHRKNGERSVEALTVDLETIKFDRHPRRNVVVVHRRLRRNAIPLTSEMPIEARVFDLTGRQISGPSKARADAAFERAIREQELEDRAEACEREECRETAKHGGDAA